MSEEKKVDSKKYPEPIVGAIIYNDKKEILLIKGYKCGKMWNVPGGHIEMNEKSETALKREIKEEVGLEIDNIEWIGWSESINNEHYHKPSHLIFLDYCARLSGGEISTNEEIDETIWIEPQKALKTLKIKPSVVNMINLYLEHIEAEVSINYKDDYYRALADYQNLLKRTAQEKSEFARFANEQMIHEIIPVYDNLKTSLEHAGDAEKNSWLEGIKYVIKQFKDVLADHGVEEINTSGVKFDHYIMDAMDSEETDDESKDDLVAKEIKPGYKLNGKVIIPAKVVVYKIMNKE